MFCVGLTPIPISCPMHWHHFFASAGCRNSRCTSAFCGK